MAAPETQSEHQPTSSKTTSLRPAQYAQLPIAHAMLMDAIETNPHYGDMFKATEKQRFGLHYLERLHITEPSHVMLCMVGDDIAGFMISSPDYGSIWLHWSYLKPEFRQGANALRFTRAFITHFDNGNFHKIATYTKPDNDIANALMKRYGFINICRLENHIFGEDYLLHERPLTKTSTGYDQGVRQEGRLRRLKRNLLKRLGV